jgi:hypothetical protein
MNGVARFRSIYMETNIISADTAIRMFPTVTAAAATTHVHCQMEILQSVGLTVRVLVTW